MLSSSAVDRAVAGLTLATNGLEAIRHHRGKKNAYSPRPPRMRPQGLTTAKKLAKVSEVSDTSGEEERGTPIHRS
jgi:hypothetical protein